MSQKVRRNLLALLSGAVVQRLALFGTTLVLARELDLETLGTLAIGIQLGSLLGLLADAGPRAVALREAAAARDPAVAFAWLRAARRCSSILALCGCGLWALGVWLAAPAAPGFWLLCGGFALTGVRDLKGLADAVGATRLEVRLESTAALALLAGVGIATWLGALDLVLLAALHLGARALYALGAEIWLARRPRVSNAVSLRELRRGIGGLSLAQAGNQFLFASDLLLLGALAGPRAAALYHVAQKIALAAEVPLGILGRLLQPHLLAAASGGDPVGTLERALRASAYLVLPIAAGGWLLAEPLLVRFYGHRFDEAAWTLRWLLAASVAMHLGSRYGNLLFARREHRPYLLGILAGMACNLALSLAWIPLWGAAGTAAASAVAIALVGVLSVVNLRRSLELPGLRPFLLPLVLALVVWATAAVVPASAGVLVRVGAGALSFGIGLWFLELRRGLGQVGAGLAAASRFDR